MRKIIFTYGLISGAIVATMVFFSMWLYNAAILDFNNGEIYGYTTMVVSLSLVFFGIRSVRDNNYDGHITFSQAVKTGLLITLIATTMYAVAWEICFNTVATDFVDKMIAHYREELVAGGATQPEVDEAMTNMESLKVWYDNPLIRFFITMMEMFWVGVLMTIVSAALLRTKQTARRTSV